jgi:hypothetical protein
MGEVRKAYRMSIGKLKRQQYLSVCGKVMLGKEDFKGM